MPSKLKPADTTLLSPAAYDDDASLRSLSEQDSDSEDDEYLSKSRTPQELAQHDRSVLEDEDELERLLTQTNPASGLRRIFSSNSSSVRIGRRGRRDGGGHKRGREQAGEHAELMFEMEEGYRDDTSSLLSTPASEEGGVSTIRKKGLSLVQPSRIPWRRLGFVLAALLIIFIIIALGAYKASNKSRAVRRKPLLSNGTALFGPTTIMISLDGFRADFLSRGLTPALNAFIADGVSPRYMLPSFPSVTFPNHFTMVTGLYPESHGIVGNTFWDPELQEEFYYTHSDVSMLAKWWNAEPIWNTAENQGLKTGVHMWPGSEAHIGDMDPTFLDRYNGSEALSRKVERILELLDLPGKEHDHLDPPGRPQFIAAYVPNVDSDGHKYGPNSTEIESAISDVDTMLGDLFSGIRERNLTDIVNIVVVSDHGMATTDISRLIQFDDFVDLDLVAHLDGWPSRGIRPKKEEDLPALEEQVQRLKAAYPDAVDVYRKETMPERYYFTNNDRIAPLWVIPSAGWAIVERPEFDVQVAIEKDDIYHPRGVHGYDHEHPLMRAIFVARGPAFPHPPNSRIEPFQNINVYNIICDSLGIKPRPNNGTLHLPLKPLGRHSDEDAPGIDVPHDPADHASSPATVSATEPEATPAATASTVKGQTETQVAAQPKARPGDENNQSISWLDTITSKLNGFKEWIEEATDSVREKLSDLIG